METRMYKHMKNTLRDIKTTLKASKNDKEKLTEIKFLIDMLESVECGEIITSDC